MQWATRTVDLPVKFGIYSLDWASSKHGDSYSEGVSRIQNLLEDTKGITDRTSLKDKLDDIKDELDDLKDSLEDESSLESYLTSFSPDKKQVFVSIPSIFNKTKELTTSTQNLEGSTYFVQISRAKNQREVFGNDVSQYAYVARPFNDRDELVHLINSVQIPKKYQAVVLNSFDEVENGEPKVAKRFKIPTQERYHPVVSKMVVPIKYVAAVGGATVGITAGGALGLGLGSVVGAMGMIVGAMGLMVGALGAAAGAVYGVSKGADLGYNLQDRLTGNHKEVTSS